MTDNRHIIWSNYYLSVNDDWREAYKEFLEINNEEIPEVITENDVYEYMVDTNNEYLCDERSNLNITLSSPILVIGDLGRWNGRRMGYKEIESGNIGDCLYSECDYCTWYVNKNGDLCCEAIHHDGTNHYVYRVYKDGVSEEQIENLKEKLYRGIATRSDITRLTRRLGDDIAAVYGFPIPRQRQAAMER